MTSKQVVGWDDQTITGGMTKRPEHYKAADGRVDRVRLLTPPKAYYTASVNPPEDSSQKGFNAISLADYNDCLAAEKGDAAALDRCKKACPLWERGFQVVRRFVTLMHWISSKDSRGREVKKDQLLPFAFAGDKYTAFRNIAASLPINSKTGKPYPLSAFEFDLSVSGADGVKYQKIQITPWTDPKQFKIKLSDSKRKVAEEGLIQGDPASPDFFSGTCVLVEEFIQPESRLSLMRSIDRVTGNDGGMEADEFSGQAAEAKPAAAGKRRVTITRPAEEPAETEELPLDDDDLGLEEDPATEAPAGEAEEGDLGELEIEPEAPAPAKTKPAAKPAAAPKPATKPAAAPKPATKPKPAAKPAPAPEAEEDVDPFG